MKNLAPILTAIASLFSFVLFAQTGVIDSTFGTNGFAYVADPEFEGLEVRTMVVQPDGKVLVLGNTRGLKKTRFVLSRFLANGMVDREFGHEGLAYLSIGYTEQAAATGLAIEGDGKILAAGYVHYKNMRNELVVARWNQDGTIDKSFGSHGSLITNYDNKLHIDAYTIHVQPDGKILMAGCNWGQFTLLMLDKKGNYDPDFGDNGMVMTAFSNRYDCAHAMAIQKDGKIVLAGTYTETNGHASTDFALVRYHPSGAIDSTFGIDGVVKDTMPEISNFVSYMAFANSIVIQPDGKMVANGNTLARRYLPNGIRDDSFGKKGEILTGIYNMEAHGSSICLQSDGKILVAGNSSNSFKGLISGLAVVNRFNTDGTLDKSFGDGGHWFVQTDSILLFKGASVAALPDGKILLAGSASKPGQGKERINKIFLTRILTAWNLGELDFSQNPVCTTPKHFKQDNYIDYTLKNSETLTIQLFDKHGKPVITFIDHELQEPGTHREKIELPDELTDGEYFLTFTAPEGKVSMYILK
jgi:uncharacterized delta-60 repeat protein